MKKINTRKILNQNENTKINKYEENPEQQKVHKKKKYQEHSKPKK